MVIFVVQEFMCVVVVCMMMSEFLQHLPYQETLVKKASAA